MLAWLAGHSLSIGTVASAAPPAVTALSPGGVQRGTTTDIALIGKLGSRPVSAWCSRDDVEVAVADEAETLSVTVPENSPAGRCWVRLYNDEGATDLLPLLVGLVPELAEIEPNNHWRDAQRVEALPATINGVLHRSGEVDTFAVALRQGDTLIASLVAHEALGSPLDAVMQLLSADGFVVEHNDDHHGSDPQIVYTAAADGVVLVRLFAFPSEPNSTINFAGGNNYLYRLTLTTGPFIDHVLPSQEGPGDRPVGWNLTPDIRPEAAPGLHQMLPERVSSGSIIANARAEDSRTLERGRSVIGELSVPGETDDYEFAATKGESLRFTVDARGIWSPLDPVLTIRDAGGKVLEESDDAARDDQDVAETWKAPADGTFRASVSDRFAHGGLRYAYRLAMDLEQPRVELSVDGNRFTLKRGEPLEISVSVRRIAGFKDELTIEAVDLPKGIDVVPGISASEGDTAKQVKLQLKATTDDACHGPFRIVARTSEAAHGVSHATASTRLSDVRSSSLWLTIAPAGTP